MYQVFHEYLQSLPESTSIPEGMELRVKFTEWATLYASVCDDLEQMQYVVEGDEYTKKRAKDVKSDDTWKPRKLIVKNSILKMFDEARQVNETHEILERAKYEEYQASESKRKIAQAPESPAPESPPRWPDADVSPGRIGSGSASIGEI